MKADLTGKKFGMLTVISKSSNVKISASGKKRCLWNLECECGNTIQLPRESFDRKKYPQKSCGCLLKTPNKIDYGKRPIDITGERFGSLTAVRLTGKRDLECKPTWLLTCDCGGTREFSKSRLNKNYGLNCGAVIHEPGLHYPPTPNPLPKEVSAVITKYLKYTRLEYCNNDSALQDERMKVLIRSAWILVFRRSLGEEIDERRYIHKCLRCCAQTVKIRRLTEVGYLLPKGNCKPEIKSYQLKDDLKVGTENIKVKKYSFKRC